MYLFDTDAITNLLKKRPSSSLIHRLKEVKPEKQFISSITIAEIVYGAIKSDRPEHHLENLETILLPMVTVLDFDVRAGYIAGHHRAKLEKLGTPLAWPDLQIAAIAISHQMTLVTGNIRHFSRIPELRVENWLR
ncbi:MAG: type II toxin-antitoxin system VapC family toxin [Thermodesulfobacteriota bacterium]